MRHDYLPKKKRIWIVFPDYARYERPAYCHWFDSKKAALSHLGDQAILGRFPSQPIPFKLCDEFGRVTLFFDLCNGDRSGRRYVWFCRGQEEIDDLIAHREKVNNPVRLSESFQCTEI